MNRLMTGAALRAAAIFDPHHGVRYRRRLQSVWREKGTPAVNAGRSAAASLEPIARRVRGKSTRKDWRGVLGAGAADRLRFGAVGVLSVAAIAALGGAAVYFLDPDAGRVRRKRLLSTWQEKRQATMEASQRTATEAAAGVKQVTGVAVTSARNGVRKAQEKLA